METAVALCLFLLLTGAAVTTGALVWLVYHFPKCLGQADLPPLPLPMPSQETPLSLRERRNRRRLRAQLRAALHLLPLLLLSSPALACDGMGPCSAYAQTAAQELAPGLNRQDREMVQASPEPVKRMGSDHPNCDLLLAMCEEGRMEAAVRNSRKPARWPWALAGLLVGALLWLPLGAWGMVRTQARWLDEDEWTVQRWAGRWIAWKVSNSQRQPQEPTKRRFWWQALRDAWRLSRGLPLLTLLLSGCTYQPVGWALVGVATALTVGLLTRPRREVR